MSEAWNDMKLHAVDNHSSPYFMAGLELLAGGRSQNLHFFAGGPCLWLMELSTVPARRYKSQNCLWRFAFTNHWRGRASAHYKPNWCILVGAWNWTEFTPRNVFCFSAGLLGWSLDRSLIGDLPAFGAEDFHDTQCSGAVLLEMPSVLESRVGGYAEMSIHFQNPASHPHIARHAASLSCTVLDVISQKICRKTCKSKRVWIDGELAAEVAEYGACTWHFPESSRCFFLGNQYHCSSHEWIAPNCITIIRTPRTQNPQVQSCCGAGTGLGMNWTGLKSARKGAWRYAKVNPEPNRHGWPFLANVANFSGHFSKMNSNWWLFLPWCLKLTTKFNAPRSRKEFAMYRVCLEKRSAQRRESSGI